MERTPNTPPKIAVVTSSDPRPLWSVMIPTFNCIHFLEKTLTSVLEQDLGEMNMQIEVVDDFSTDGDVESLVRRVGSGRVGYYRQPFNKGSLRNFETCINRARGKLIHILHGDDFVCPGFYREIERLFRENPEAGAAFTNFMFVNKFGMVDHRNRPLIANRGIIPDFLTHIALKQQVQPPAMVVKRSTYETLGGFFAVHFGEDWEMWARIAAHYPVAFSPESLAAYRVAHGNGISHHSILNGQNILDIKKVIGIIQNYLPNQKRKAIKKLATEYYAIYCIKIANGLLLTNRTAALRQANGAFNMSRSLKTMYWFTRFYLMYIFHVKDFIKRMSAPENALKN